MHNAVDKAVALLRTVRSNVQKIVVILTGGKQSFVQDVRVLKESFKTLRATGTNAFVVAIGSDHDREELLPAVDRSEDIFTVASFEKLVQQAWPTSKTIAERTGARQRFYCTRLYIVTFLVIATVQYHVVMKACFLQPIFTF